MAVSKEKKEVSIRSFAKLIGTSHTAVNNAISNSKFPHGYNTETKKIDVAAAMKNTWVKEQKHVTPKRGVSLSKAIDKLDKKKTGKPKKEKEPVYEDMDLEELLSTLKVNSNMTPDLAYKNQQIINLAQSRLKLQQDIGLLVDKAKVNNALYKIGNEIKKDLMNIPKRIARDVMAAPNEVEAINIMNDEFNQVLASYSNLKLNIV